jgi:hypothetical protein
MNPGRIVMVESPYRNGDRDYNLRYLAWCEYSVAKDGDFPIASHGNCTAYWPEDDRHRMRGFAWRDAIASRADLIVYFDDLGLSPGALEAMKRDKAANRSVQRRRLPVELFTLFVEGKSPLGSMKRVSVSVSKER